MLCSVEIRSVDLVDPSEIECLFWREIMIFSISDDLEQLLAGLLRFSGTRAKNVGEFSLVAFHGFPCQLHFLSVGAVQRQAKSVIHQRRVRQADANVCTLKEPECTALRCDHQEGEVQLEEFSKHQHAVVALATVINATSVAVEDDRDMRSIMLSGKILQNRYVALASGHAPGPVEDVCSVVTGHWLRGFRTRVTLTLTVTVHGVAG